MKNIEISNLTLHCEYLLKESENCKSYNRCRADKYKNYYNKAVLIKKKIEQMSSKIKDERSFGLTYIVSVHTLDEYFELYNLLKLIPESEIKIFTPDSISVYEKTYDFCQTD